MSDANTSDSRQTPRPAVRDELASLEGYHSPQVDVEVRLNTNEAPGPPPPEFVEAVIEAVRSVDWHRYPDRSAEQLRLAIGELHGLPASQVFCANGSNEVLQTILLTFGGPGRKVLTFEPTYAMHQHIARITGAEALSCERGPNFEIDLNTALGLIETERPAVTFLTSPNNPTGIVETEDTLCQVLDAVTAVGGLLVVDEAYGQFASWSAVGAVDEQRPLVVTRTYSKTWAMAGARLGYLLGPQWLVAELEKVVLPYHLDAVKQAAGLAALQFMPEMETRVAEINEERERISSTLASQGATVWPSDANFVLFRPPGGDANRIWEDLLAQSVLVRNTSGWDRLDGCLRVTVGTRSDNDRFLGAFASAVSGNTSDASTPKEKQ